MFSRKWDFKTDVRHTIKTEIRRDLIGKSPALTQPTHTDGPKVRIPQAIRCYWLTADLIPELHVELLHILPLYLEEHLCPEHTGVQEYV